MKLQASIVVSCLICVPAYAAAQSGHAVPSVHVISEQMGRARAANASRFKPYILTRSYEIFDADKRNVPKSKVIADISFLPPSQKTFVIQEATGSSWGEKSVRHILENEVALTRDSSEADISEANYTLRFIREEEVGKRRCYVLGIIPKREDKSLLRGTVWVDAETYLLRRVEGTVVKNPSWWVKHVHVVLVFGDAEGMWMQTELEATADVRLLGESVLIARNKKLVTGDRELTQATTKHETKKGL
jgi:hypothetical protein